MHSLFEQRRNEKQLDELLNHPCPGCGLTFRIRIEATTTNDPTRIALSPVIDHTCNTKTRTAA